jgi:Uma2 family endonuclease
MGAAKVLPYYTFTDWERWEGDWELIEGLPFAMSPAPLPKHQRIALNVAQQLNQHLENCKTCKVYQAIDWIIKEDTILQPDVLVVCGNIKHRLNFPPELTIEILSPATALKDRKNKFFIYREQKVKYYLIIDPETNTVEVYVHNGDTYQQETHAGVYHFTFSQSCSAEINFGAIWE